MSRPLQIVSMLLVGAALAVAGCGGDDDSEGTSDSASKQEFIAQADQICAEGDAQIDKEGLAFGATGDADELVGTVIAPGFRSEIEQLRALTPPEPDQAAVEEFIDTLERGVDQLEANPKQLLSGEAYETILEARRLAAAYGLSACARGA